MHTPPVPLTPEGRRRSRRAAEALVTYFSAFACVAAIANGYGQERELRRHLPDQRLALQHDPLRPRPEPCAAVPLTRFL